jgi:CMP/dCMP kinase
VSEVITIDGPVSSGKSSVGHLFSERIGYKFIDTGSIYRVYTLFAIEQNLPLDRDAELAEKFSRIQIKFEYEQNKYQVFADGRDVTDLLHRPDVTDLVPIIAAKAKVREISKNMQREIGLLADTVMNGRDIGTEIFPEAKLKYYITASPEVRAHRRYEQLKDTNPNITEAEILEQIRERDKMDSQREASPMRIPEGAVVIDTSDKTVEESVEELLKHFKN